MCVSLRECVRCQMSAEHSKYDPVVEKAEKAVRGAIKHYEKRCKEMDERKWGEQKCTRYMRFVIYYRVFRALIGEKL